MKPERMMCDWAEVGRMSSRINREVDVESSKQTRDELKEGDDQQPFDQGKGYMYVIISYLSLGR